MSVPRIAGSFRTPVLLHAIAIASLWVVPVLPLDASTVQQKTSKPAAKRAAPASAAIPATLLRSIRVAVQDAVKVKNVTAPGRGVVRVAIEQPLVKDATYRAVLTAACGEIVKVSARRRVTAIEIVNVDARQGYVYRPTSNCAEVIAADEDGRRLAILPGTTVFRVRR